MAELGAIETTPRDRLVPLLEILEPSKSKDRLPKSWRTVNDAVWIHFPNVAGLSDSALSKQITDLFNHMRGNVCAVPVVTTAEGQTTLSAISKVISQDGHGAVLRIDVEDLLNISLGNNAQIAQTISQLGVPRSEVSLVVDGGTLTGSSTAQANLAIQALNLLNLSEWLCVVLSFSGFPGDLGAVAGKNRVTHIPRADAESFNIVRRNVNHPLIYSDYAVGTPSYLTAPHAPIPNIRYTTDNDWSIHRANSTKARSPQYVKLAKDVVGAPYYKGARFSPGDQEINDVATRASGPGNPMTHLRAATSHHLHLVLSRLATLGAP